MLRGADLEVVTLVFGAEPRPIQVNSRVLLVPLSGTLAVGAPASACVSRLGAILLPTGAAVQARATQGERCRVLLVHLRHQTRRAGGRRPHAAAPGSRAAEAIAASTARLVVAWQRGRDTLHAAASELMDRLTVEPGAALNARPSGDPRLDLLVTRLEASLAEHHSLRRAAALVSCHPIHLARIFRRRYGCSLGDFRNRRRIDHAVAALVGERPPHLAALAVDLGFADQSHLTRVFRRHVGCAPGACARLLGNVSPSGAGAVGTAFR
jgi:AraC-like DNA-binding protein